jgi:hypothetical protein
MKSVAPNSGVATARLGERVAVATCIACGARSRVGDCPAGCSDVPLDLVEAAEVDALAARVDALEARSRAFEGLLPAAARGVPWAELQRAARAALDLPLAETPPEPAIVQAWGCPDCGRIDAPQPCLDVCIRRPVLMADAADHRELASALAEAEEREQRLRSLAELVVRVQPKPGFEQRARDALAAKDYSSASTSRVSSTPVRQTRSTSSSGRS